MKTGEAAKRLGVDPKTIRTWLDQPELESFFSPDARGVNVSQRVINDDEFDVLATVYMLRYRDNLGDWNDIARKLASGMREEIRPLDGITAQSETVSRPFAEQSARAAATVAERDAALARVQELEDEIERLRDEYESRLEKTERQHREETRMLWERIAELNQQIGILRGKYEADE